MKRKNIYSIILSSVLLTSLSSCNSTNVFEKVSTINFYDGDNKLITISGKYGSEIDYDILSKIVVKENATFKGWYRDKEFTTKKENVYYFPFEETVNYYGFFANHVTITLLKDDEDAIYPTSYTSSGQTVNYKYEYNGVEKEVIENLELPTPSKENYTFDGWYIKGEDTKFDSRLYPKYDTELYAKFTIYPTLSFVVSSKTIDPVLVQPGSSIASAIERAGITKDILYMDTEHKFYAWYYDNEYKNIVNPTTNTMPDSSITLYAKYVSKKTIIFDTSSIDSSISIPSITKFPGDNIVAPSLSSSTLLDTSTSYFDSWYEKDENNNFKSTPFFKENYTMPDIEGDTITLYPKLNNKYKFDIYNEGNLITSIYVKPDQATNLNNIIVDNISLTSYIANIESTQDKKFIGFYTLKDSTKTYIDNSTAYINNSDINIYLEFENKNTVSFSFEDVNNASISLSTYSIKTYDVIEDPTLILTNYIKSSSLYSSKDFKILKYLDNSGNNITFPQVSKDISYRVIISTLVNVKYNVYTIDSSYTPSLIGQNSISVYQGDTFKKDDKEVSPILNDGSNIYIYGNKYESIDASKYIFKKATLTSDTSIETDLYNLGPVNDVEINIYFELKN